MRIRKKTTNKLFRLFFSFSSISFVLACTEQDPIETRRGDNSLCSEVANNCPLIERISPKVGKPGDLIKIQGKNLSSSFKLVAEGKEITTTLIDPKSATFRLPEGKNGYLSLEAIDGRQAISLSSNLNKIYLQDNDDFPVITADISLICDDLQFLNSEGNLTRGTKICAVNSDKNLIPENLKSGIVIGTVIGTLEATPLTQVCSSDGQIDCTTNPSFRAVQTNQIASKTIVGQLLAGIAGNVNLPLASKVLSSIQYGVPGAELTGTLILPSSSNVLASTGSYGDPNAPLTPSYNPDFPLAANVSASDTVNNSAGTLSTCSAANQSGCITTTTFKSMDLSAAATATGLTSSNFLTRIAAASNSEFWDALGARHSIAGDSDLSIANIKSGVAIHGVTGQYPSGSYPLATNTAATDFTQFATQLTTNGSFEFFDSTGVKFTGSGDSNLSAANFKQGLLLSSIGFYGNFRYDCPTDWVVVPGDSSYGTNDFCVMRYEAKNIASVATSQAATAPWVSISQIDAITSCRALGTGYDLISNAEWMTIASNLAYKDQNWTSGTRGTGTIYSGHNDDSPATACEAPSNNTHFYIESDCTPISSGDSIDQRRILTLSNDEIIWDFAGNATEWVNYLNRGDKPGATNAWYEFTALTATTTLPIRDLVPTNAVKSYWNNSWNSAQGIGQFFPATNGSGGTLRRGGAWNNGNSAGIFNASLYHDPTAADTFIGFRCVYRPPNPYVPGA